jgi:hypothetical protein
VLEVRCGGTQCDCRLRSPIAIAIAITHHPSWPVASVMVCGTWSSMGLYVYWLLPAATVACRIARRLPHRAPRAGCPLRPAPPRRGPVLLGAGCWAAHPQALEAPH